MKRIVPTLFALLLCGVPAWAAGLMKPKDGSLPPLQIKDHKVSVVINNGFAVTEVDQVFHNPHDQDLEAMYTFPLPKDASLSELSLWIDGHEVIGEVVEKEKAREIYREEKKAGRDSALAEKRDYIAFDVYVSPVRARSDTRVRLLYLQPLEIDSGIGRYVYPLREGRIDSEVQEFWELLPQVHGRFGFDCLIRSAYAVEDVRAKGYEKLTTVKQEASDAWRVRIDAEEGGSALDQDVVVYYRLDQTLPARVDLLAHRVGDSAGTFLVVITPGTDLRPIEEGVDWSIVLDVSGSMSEKIGTASEAIADALDRMRPRDRFRVVTFSNAARPLVDEWTPVTPESVRAARERLLALQSEGGTNLYAGFLEGLSKIDEGRTTAILLVSDGGANVGPTEHKVFRRVLDRHDVRVFTFVMGQGANQPLLSRLAEESDGFSMEVSTQDDLYGRILQAKTKLGREALHGVRIEIDGVNASDLAPARLPSVYYGQQVAVFGRYHKPGVAVLRLRGRISGAEKSWETRVTLPAATPPGSADAYPELERLWALARVRDLTRRIEDEGKESELRAAVVDLGTAYSIVTDYTSMIVVREERFKDLGLDRRNRDRAGNERQAREVRATQAPRAPRADGGQPMFGNAPSHGHG
ncbi:MAG: VIT and vWA domain-containing protein, partial [Candidatus Rokuibacteriota bacterium]